MAGREGLPEMATVGIEAGRVVSVVYDITCSQLSGARPAPDAVLVLCQTHGPLLRERPAACIRYGLPAQIDPVVAGTGQQPLLKRFERQAALARRDQRSGCGSRVHPPYPSSSQRLMTSPTRRCPSPEPAPGTSVSACAGPSRSGHLSGIATHCPVRGRRCRSLRRSVLPRKVQMARRSGSGAGHRPSAWCSGRKPSMLVTGSD